MASKKDFHVCLCFVYTQKKQNFINLAQKSVKEGRLSDIFLNIYIDLSHLVCKHTQL